MNQRTLLKGASYLVLCRGNSILLSLRKNTGYLDGFYTLVSGHVEENESFTDAMIREAKEEAGITINAKDLTVLHVSQRVLEGYVDIFFDATKWEGEIVNGEPEKCVALEWHDMDSLPENIFPNVLFVLDKIQEKSMYSELTKSNTSKDSLEDNE